MESLVSSTILRIPWDFLFLLGLLSIMIFFYPYKGKLIAIELKSESIICGKLHWGYTKLFLLLGSSFLTLSFYSYYRLPDFGFYKKTGH
jgi:hypothetical protein